MAEQGTHLYGRQWEVRGSQNLYAAEYSSVSVHIALHFTSLASQTPLRRVWLARLTFHICKHLLIMADKRF